jgi:hypothetical protein
MIESGREGIGLLAIPANPLTLLSIQATLLNWNVTENCFPFKQFAPSASPKPESDPPASPPSQPPARSLIRALAGSRAHCARANAETRKQRIFPVGTRSGLPVEPPLPGRLAAACFHTLLESKIGFCSGAGSPLLAVQATFRVAPVLEPVVHDRNAHPIPCAFRRATGTENGFCPQLAGTGDGIPSRNTRIECGNYRVMQRHWRNLVSAIGKPSSGQPRNTRGHNI